MRTPLFKGGSWEMAYPPRRCQAKTEEEIMNYQNLVDQLNAMRQQVSDLYVRDPEEYVPKGLMTEEVSNA